MIGFSAKSYGYLLIFSVKSYGYLFIYVRTSKIEWGKDQNVGNRYKLCKITS